MEVELPQDRRSLAGVLDSGDKEIVAEPGLEIPLVHRRCHGSCSTLQEPPENALDMQEPTGGQHMREDELIDVRAVQRRLGGISGATIWRLEKAGQLTPVRIRRRKLYRRSEVDQLIEDASPPNDAGSSSSG
jgi:hypothetical protein